MTDPLAPSGSREPAAPVPQAPPAEPSGEVLPAMTPVARVEEVTAPVTQPVGTRGGGRARWLVALAATLVVVIIAGAIIVVAGSTGSKAVAPAYLPAETLLYADARLDMPGDQRDQMAALLAKFPGFADQANLEAKLDDALDRLVKNASGDKYTYTGNVKSWFGGQIGLGAWSSGGADGSPSGVLVLSVSDRSKLPTQLDQASQDLAKELGVKVTVTDHGGISIITLAGATGTTPMPGLENLSFAITDDAVVAAQDSAAVGAALDRKAGKAPNLAGASGFQEALASLDRDRLGTLYVDGAAVAKLVPALPSPAASAGSALLKLPQTIVGELRLEGGNIVAHGRVTPAAAAASAEPAAKPATSTTAEHVPGDAALYVEVHDVSTGWQRLITALKGQPGYDQIAPQLGTLEGVLGSKLDAYLDWARDLGVAVTLRDGQAGGGLVVTASNAATGDARLRQLVTLLRLAGTSGITVSEQPYKGTTITTLTLDLAVLGQLGGGGSIVPLPSGLSPAPAAPLGSGKVELSYAFSGDTFVLGLGDGFVKQVLDVTPSTSLASQARYTDALKAAGGPASTGHAYADLAAWRTFLERQVPAADKAKYESDVKPYLVPFDRLVALATRDGDVVVGTLIVFVTK